MALVPGEPHDCCLTERRVVEVLHTEGDQVLVRGTLQDGELVVIDGLHRIVAGQLVRTVPMSTSPPSEVAPTLTTLALQENEERCR